MTYPHGGASDIWRDGDGGAQNPRKAEIRDWGTSVENRVGAVEDQAFTAAPVFPGVTEGLAGTADGGRFTVVSGDDNILYQRVDALTATELSRITNAAGFRKVSSSARMSKSMDDQNSLSRPRNLFDEVEEGYIIKADGSESSASSNWRRTDFIEVTADTVILKDCAAIIGGSSAAAAIAYYASNFSYLGSTVQAVRDIEVRVGEEFPTAKYVRFSFNATGSYNSAFLKRPGLYKVARRELGAVSDLAAVDPKARIGRYIHKDTGAEVTASSWGCSDFIAVTPDAVLVRDALYVQQNSSVAPVAFYDAAQSFLGYFRPLDRAERFVVGDLFPTAAFVRYTWQTAEHPTKNLLMAKPVNRGSVEQLVSALQRDFTQEGGLSNHWVGDDGVFNSASNWRTTPLIPVREGQVFVFSSDVIGSSGVAHVSAWDASGAFVSSLLTGDNTSDVLTDVAVTVPAGVAYVRATWAITATYASFKGVPSDGGAGDAAEISALVPEEAYALQGEPLYLYARGIVADRSLDLAWNYSQSNEDLCIVTPSSTADVPLTLRARGSDNIQRDVGSFNVKVTGTPINPAGARNVICLGDSLTLGESNAGIQGAYPNELSRRLTGVGHELLSGAQSPAPLSLSNFRFRGTLGNQAVQHEGRGGWDADRYLTQANGNAFWNATSGAFDLDHYLTANSFDDGSIADGVNASGSNLTMVILLGWNDVYNETAAASAADLGLLIDKIHEARSATDIVLVGLNPAPEINHKSFNGTRFVSEREVFDVAVRQFGEAYRDLAASKANTKFLQLSHVFNPNIGYPTGTRLISGRSALTQTGATDHVHPNAVGYAMIADAIFYYLLYAYCR